MKTFTTCAEKKAKQFLNLLQGYTKGIRITAILILLLMGVSNAWAWDVEEGKVYYFKPSTVWKSDNARFAIAFGSGDNTYAWQSCVAVSGETDTYYVTSPGNYDWMIFVRMNPANNTNDWSNKWNESQRVQPNNNYNKFELKANWATDFNWYKFAPPMKSVTISNDGSTVYGGDGTSNNPYQIKKGATISVQASATSSVPNDPQTKYYRFYKKENSGTRSAIGNESTTTTSSFTASSTVGTKYEVDVEARNEYYSTYGTKATSSKLYFVTIEPIYAILGSFNNWTHSANTWDLSDQGSNTWKATFHLEQGNHTFKVVHNSSYYGKNSTTITRSSATASSLSTSGADINLTADYAGNYTFTFNSSTKNLTVTYPTIYKVTYSQTPAAAASAPTTSPSVQSGNSVVSGTSLTFTAQTAKTGYTWKGWYSNNAGTGDALTTNLAYTKSITANTTIYAVYTANTYTVKFDANGGTGSMSNQNFTYGTSQNLTANTFTRTGYTFAGWATSANGNKVYNDKQSVSNLSTTNGAIVTLYAKWTATNYTVTYNTNGGNSIAQKTYTIETATFDLPTPTRTGYTFAGWYDNENLTGNKVTQVAKGSTGNKTFYAAWTINQYTLTYSAGEGGTVSGSHASGTKIDYNTSITLTATPATGYSFVKWVEGSTQLSTNATYTFPLNADKNIQAVFAQYKTIYLKPGAWASNNARFAVYAFGNGEEWYDMEQSDCNNEHYQCDINGKYTTVIICRMNPSTSANNFNNGVLWNQTADLTIPAEGMCFYDRTKIYLKPNANWKADGARFAAYFYLNSDGEKHKWMSMLVTDEEGVFYCNYPTEEAYDRVIFCRMNGNEEYNDWGNRYDQTNGIDLYTGGNIYTINDGQWGGDGNNNSGATGTWSYIWKEPTYPLTLKATPYGEYTVKCNGVSHTSSRTKDIVIDLPVGATVEITNDTSYNAAYNSDLVIKTSSNSQYEAAELNTTYTICGATTIEENFTTTAGHVVYLRVAPSAAAEWNENGNKNYIYCTNRLTNKVVAMEAVAAGNSEINQETGYNYFKATIPAGYRAFRFERKTSESADTDTYTEYFEHLLPLGQSNCFTIKGKNISLGTFYGDWALGTAEGDYRILYVEQQVAHGTDENDWQTVIDTTYQHASDIIKKGDDETIVSLHIKYDKTKHPEVILQKFTGGKWVDVEGQAHMLLGPLTASADMAMLPGRRNTEGDANLRYGDGIEEIKADAEENGKAGRVWNFVVKQSGASAHIDFNTNDFAPYPYTRNYYIRTDNAAGGWMTYAIPGNVMSHSDYSLEHSDYSHYFCKWVSLDGTPNVKFVVANDYGAAISDTIVADDFTDTNGTLEEAANVRWMWNEYTNEGSRAYIAGSSGSSASNFLVAKYAASSSKTFEDKGEWVYEADLENVQIDDKLTSIAATYDDQVQELLEKSHADAGGLVMLASARNDARVSSYTVRIVYDFKINQTICYLIPTGAAVATSIDVLIERTNQDEEGNATQVTAAITPANAEGLTVYGLITLTQDHITDSSKSEQEALTYWISFPFDVKIGDITGFGEVGKHWMIKYYDGAERAKKGWFLDTKTFWKFFLDTDSVMKANTGYVLTLNKSLLNKSNPVYDNTKILKLYFPSMNKIKDDITSGWTETSVTLKPLECKITSPADRTVKDSHWNLIGVPSYAHKTNNHNVRFFYNYNFHEDTYDAEKNTGPETFHAMHAYMVQFAGTIDWSTFTTPAQLAAKKNTDAEEQYTLRLELQQNGTKADQTFVELHDDATTMFDMNVDLTKMFNTGANIYTLIGSDNQVAANVMPIANTTIPVGVQIAKAGEYTFAMPDGTDGITVELIDYETNTTTNLLLSEYNVSLPAGTFENRFALIVKPNKVATDMETIDDETNGVKKYIIDGKLFLQKDGMLYDAQGHIVR